MSLIERIDKWIFGKVDAAFQPKQKPPAEVSHDWSKWEDQKNFTMTVRNSESIIGGSTVQKRTCKKCGAGEYRKHGWGDWK